MLVIVYATSTSQGLDSQRLLTWKQRPMWDCQADGSSALTAQTLPVVAAILPVFVMTRQYTILQHITVLIKVLLEYLITNGFLFSTFRNTGSSASVWISSGRATGNSSGSLSGTNRQHHMFVQRWVWNGRWSSGFHPGFVYEPHDTHTWQNSIGCCCECRELHPHWNLHYWYVERTVQMWWQYQSFPN